MTIGRVSFGPLFNIYVFPSTVFFTVIDSKIIFFFFAPLFTAASFSTCLTNRFVLTTARE